jgi:hypothetical protein
VVKSVRGSVFFKGVFVCNQSGYHPNEDVGKKKLNLAINKI